MTVPLCAIALLAALFWRSRRQRGHLDLEICSLLSAAWIGTIGLMAVALALVGALNLLSVCAGLIGLSALTLLIPVHGSTRASPSITPSKPRQRAQSLAETLLFLAIVLLGMAIRLPGIPAPLAGRDQGTYALRAALTATTGELGFRDPILHAAGTRPADLDPRPGPADLLGLYAKTQDPGRAGHYEASYRPGLYLADRDRGEVVPQFFHLHPTLLALGHLAAGARGIQAVVATQALISLLLFGAIARRLWPGAPEAHGAAILFAIAPVLIWVQRVPLSEGPMLLFLLAAALSLLRARSGDRPSNSAPLAAAFFLGLCAWVRGNALMTAPLLLLLLLLRPRGKGHAPHLLLAMLLASLATHAFTTYPYLLDELTRQVPYIASWLPPGPIPMIGLGALACAVWLGVDHLLGRRVIAPALADIRNLLPSVLAKILGLAVFSAIVLQLTQAIGVEGPPFGRLDPSPALLGWPVIIAALAGVALLSLRWRPTADDIWLLALASVPVLTLFLYAERNLPKLELYYYGRYLVPELLPIAILAATAALVWIRQRLQHRYGRAAPVLLGLAWIGMGWSVGGVLVTEPTTRFREHREARHALSWLTEHIPKDAIVLAGGEGWHHGHTHNQIAGALALEYGRHIIPYRSIEAAYGSLWELLIARPDATGTPPPPIYMLINEASHNYALASGKHVAGLDDMLPAPFRSQEVGLLELFVHALTPTRSRPPSRITRHELRMALMRIDVDPVRLAQIEAWSFAQGPGPSIRLAEDHWVDGRLCLRPDLPLEVLLPAAKQARISPRPASLVLVAQPGTARANHRWRVEADGSPLSFDAAGISPRARDTLGPVPLLARPRRIKIWGDRRGTPGAACPHGGLAELRLLPPDRSQLDHAGLAWSVAVTGEHDYGVAYPFSGWVSARSISRYRPGTRPKPTIHGFSMRLEANRALDFAPLYLPAAGSKPLDILVTLTSTELSAHAQLNLRDAGVEIARFDLPAGPLPAGPLPPLRWRPDRPIIDLRAEFTGRAGDHVDIRDIAFFAHDRPITSERLKP